MQKLVDEVNTAADDTGSFNTVSDHLIKSAEKADYPIHYAWERRGEFDTAYRASTKKDADMTANFAIIVRSDHYTFTKLETLWRSVLNNVADADVNDADFFDAQFGPERVRICIYQMQLDTTVDI